MANKVPTYRVIPNRYEESPERKADRAFYSSARWRRLAKAYKKQHPLCECGCGQPSQEVHHIIDRKQAPELAFDWNNLKAMKKACHSKETRARQLKKRDSIALKEKEPSDE